MLRRTGQRRFAIAMIGTTVALSLFLLLSYDPLGLQIVECRDEACRATIPPQFLINRRTSGYIFRNESVATTSRGRARRFVVVFDAGSTGTRVHCFDFARARPGDDDINTGRKPFALEAEMFEKIEPGLSSYAKDPKEGAASIVPLLRLAQNFIPEEYHAQTPVILRATAGLRLLSENVSSALLREVEVVINASPFRRVKGAVAILNGESEGLFAWLSVNFLRGSLGKDSSRTAGILDLGGGSVQIAVALDDNSTIEANKHLEIFNKRYSLFIQSYLGLGLMKARVSILDATDIDLSDRVVTSPCLPKGSTGAWEYMQRAFELRGGDAKPSSGRACYTKINNALFGQRSEKISIAPEQTMFAFSYFYDRAIDAQLIGHSIGGTVTVEKFEEQSSGECEVGCASACAKPFACLDMSYITSLLHHGFGFGKSQKLILKNKINAVEISWALGAALSHVLDDKTDA